MSGAIRVWPFEEAPEELRHLSRNGGDEDWVAVIPPEYRDQEIGWMKEGSQFGVYCVDEYPHPHCDGWVVRIGSHP